MENENSTQDKDLSNTEVPEKGPSWADRFRSYRVASVFARLIYIGILLLFLGFLKVAGYFSDTGHGLDLFFDHTYNPPVWEPLDPDKYADQGEEFLKGLAFYNEKKFPEALTVWDDLGNEGHIEAKYWAGFLMTFEYFGQMNRTKALAFFVVSSAAGHADATYQHGRYHKLGWVVQKNLDSGCSLYERAMHLGSALGGTGFALCVSKGHGAREPDKLRAIEIYDIAADLGDCLAHRNLGSLLGWGEHGISSDKRRAYYHYKMAEKLGCDWETHRILIQFTMWPPDVWKIDAEFKNETSSSLGKP